MLSGDPVVALSLARTGVDVQKLLPRPRGAFRKDASDSAADLKLRQTQYDEMRVWLLAMVLEERADAAVALAVSQAEFAQTAVDVRRAVAETLAVEQARMLKSRALTNKVKAAFAREEASMALRKEEARLAQVELERRIAAKQEARQKQLAELAARGTKRTEAIERINAARKEAVAKEMEATKRALEEKEARHAAALSAADATAALEDVDGKKRAEIEQKRAKQMEQYQAKVKRVKAQLEAEKVRLREAAAVQEKRQQEKEEAQRAEFARLKDEHYKRDALRRENAERIRREREFRHAEGEAKMARYLAKVRMEEDAGGGEGEGRTHPPAPHTPRSHPLSLLFPSFSHLRRWPPWRRPGRRCRAPGRRTRSASGWSGTCGGRSTATSTTRRPGPASSTRRHSSSSPPSRASRRSTSRRASSCARTT
jgi:chemotaxis protein histidine kinase CheA